MKKQAVFFVLSLLWGFPMTLIGAVVAFALILVGEKPERHGWCWYFTVGENWGGVSLGCVFLVDNRGNRDNQHTKNHEFGHALQNAMFGPFMPFLVGIPSAIRYWYRELRYYRRGRVPKTNYEDIWFEKQASLLGTKMIRILSNEGGEK